MEKNKRESMPIWGNLVLKKREKTIVSGSKIYHFVNHS